MPRDSAFPALTAPDRYATGNVVRLAVAQASAGANATVVYATGAPSFFTGRLIGRLGAPRVVIAGLALIGAAAATGLLGQDVTHFWLTLILLGLGWNFGFVGASSMVLECHRPEERTRVQSLNDFIVFGTMALGSFASGGLLTAYGWDAVLTVAFGPLGLAVMALAVGVATRRTAVSS